jgi:hypothetical protein
MNGTKMTTRYYYAEVRHDRSGSAIWHYLHAHAFYKAKIHNNTNNKMQTVFGGVCGPPFWNNMGRFQQQRDFVEMMGFASIFPYTLKPCPSQKAGEEEQVEEQSEQQHFLLDKGIYYDPRTRNQYLTDEWTSFVKGLSSKASFDTNTTKATNNTNRNTTNNNNNTTTIVIHVRRGDVEPCDNMTVHRYITNQYYIDTIREYVAKANTNNNHNHSPQKTKIIVHSQNRSTEPWDDNFLRSLTEAAAATTTTDGGNADGNGDGDGNVEVVLKLDVPVTEVWKDMMMEADMLVLSKSMFSYVPALFSQKAKTIVCQPFFHPCLPQWDQPSTQQIAKESRRIKTLINQCDEIIDHTQWLKSPDPTIRAKYREYLDGT